MTSRPITKTFFIVLGITAVGGLYMYARHTTLVAGTTQTALVENTIADTTTTATSEQNVTPPIVHLDTPTNVHGVYLTGYSAGTEKAVARILDMARRGEVNAVVIDIKDAGGKLSYQPLDPELQSEKIGTNRIRDLVSVMNAFHSQGVYVIGRVAVFQDPFFAALFPDQAFHNSITGEVWKDKKGIAWLRPDKLQVWDHVVAIARDAYAQGFDEINVDYVRFPSDGNIVALDKSDMTKTRAETIADFFTYLDQKIRGESHIPLSADVFGLTTSAQDDLGIGQKFELIAPHVDYICPMIYPSHYALGSFGFAQPAAKPYEIIHRALADAKQKLIANNEPTTKLRPWLQDFNLVGVSYTPPYIDAQIKASTELGIDAWLFWDPRNMYTSFQAAPLIGSAPTQTTVAKNETESATE